MLLLKQFLILTIILFILIVGWMNLTKGYFQVTQCGCRVEYLPDSYNPSKIYCMNYCVVGPIGKIKLLLSRLDFNK